MKTQHSSFTFFNFFISLNFAWKNKQNCQNGHNSIFSHVLEIDDFFSGEFLLF